MKIVILILPLALAASHRAAPGDFTSAIAEGRAALTSMIANGQAPGVGVAVAVTGNVVWSEGFGYADLEHHVAASPDTKFGLGSISKTLTMAAALRLVDKGQLDLDRPIEKYLPDFPHRNRGITIRRLATHQSGLSDAFAVRHYTTQRIFPTLDSAYQEMKGDPPESAAGTTVVYATGLFTMIGRVLETASGRDYRALMVEEVFLPIGINPVENTPSAIIPNRAVYYSNAKSGGFEPAPVVNPSFKLPGAGYMATAAEVAKFGAALLRDSFFSDRARADMFRAVPLADGTPTEWALGLQVASNEHGRLLHLPGGGLGISSWLFIYPDADVVIALLSNVNTAPVGGRVARRITDAFIAAAQQADVPSGLLRP